MRDRERRAAPNFTNAALVMGFVNLLWIFLVLWAVYGLHIVIAVGYVLNLMIQRIGRRAQTR